MWICFIAGVLVPIGFLLATELGISCFLSQWSLWLLAFWLAFTVLAAATCLLLWFGWESEQHSKKLDAAFALTSVSGLFFTISQIGLRTSEQDATCSPNLIYGDLAAASCLGSCALWIINCFIILPARRFFQLNCETEEHAPQISNCQVKMLLLEVVASWYITLGAALFSWLEEKWVFVDAVYFCILSLTTIGASDMTFEAIASEILFPIYASCGLILFGMILFSIRTIILEWITFRVSYRTYAIINNWAEIHDLGWDEIDVDKLWKSLDHGSSTSSSETVPIVTKDEPGKQPAFSHHNSWSLNVGSAPLLPPGVVEDFGKTWEAGRRATRFETKTNKHARNWTDMMRNENKGRQVTSNLATLPEEQQHGFKHIPIRQFKTFTAKPTSASYSFKRAQTAQQMSNSHINSMKLYTLLQESLVSQLLLAAVLNSIYAIIFAGLLAYAEKWSYITSLNVCFGAVTTIGSNKYPKSQEGKAVFLGGIIFGMGLMMYLGSIIAELITNLWRIHVETVAQEEELDQIDL